MTTTTNQPAAERITAEVTSWPGVSAGTGERGELSFKLGRREIGHLHGDHALHIGFPKQQWSELHEQGRIDYHPVFPGRPGYAARRIEREADVEDVIALLRLNYDRAVARHGLPAGAPGGLHPSPATTLPFAPSLEVRAFLLERERGNLLLYSATGAGPGWARGLGGATRQYLGHGHEALFPPDAPVAPVFVHAADRAAVRRMPARAAFSRRHALDEDFEAIPMPGHTPGSTAYLWDSGAERILFTADSVWLDGGEWMAAVLESSDRAAYVDSLELLGELEFDVLVPWAASRGGAWYARTDRADARRRLGAIADRVRDGADR